MTYKRVEFRTRRGKEVSFRVRVKGRPPATKAKVKTRKKRVRRDDALIARW